MLAATTLEKEGGEDWRVIEDWLCKCLNTKEVPSFERSPETLEYLSLLYRKNNANETLLKDDILPALCDLESQYRKENARLQEKCSRIHLDRDFSKGSERILNNLCELGEILGVPEITLGRMMSAMSKLDRKELEIAERLKLMSETIAEWDMLIVEQERTQAELRSMLEFYDRNKAAHGNDLRVWSEWTKTLKTKSEEYLGKGERLRAAYEANVEAGSSGISVPDLVALEQDHRTLEELVECKKKELSVYRDLPPDLTLARLKLAELEGNLKEMLMVREGRIGMMANSLS